MAQEQPPRVFVRFSKEQYDQFADWSKRLTIPVANLVAICAWTGSHTLIPKMLPEVHEQLELIRERHESDYWAAQAQAMYEVSEEERKLFQDFEQYRSEFEEWRKERGLHNDVE